MRSFWESLGLSGRVSAGRAGVLMGTLAAAGALAGLGWPSSAAACGGLFCNNSQPVNQTAERILFVDNGDDTTTAVIEIQYQGPAERFAWVLPVPEIANPDEDIRVSSELALDRLQQATNPQYRLTVRFEDDCQRPGAQMVTGTTAGPADPAATPPPNAAMEPAVVVEASGSVGPFDWELIATNPDFDDPAQEAIDWLEENDYDVGDLGPELLRPYLADDNKLLAVRLTKGNDTGSIRPLMITYAGDKPSIPIKPTAVAADPDMGIMVWVGGKERAIPKNYNLLELNEALIDWFQPMRNYNDVVTAAADEAGGHGFVTEYANSSTTLQNTVVPVFERNNWASFSGQTFPSGIQMLNRASGLFGRWDGFRDAVSGSITIPDGADFDIEDVLGCPNCYLGTPMSAQEDAPRASLDMELLRRLLFEQVVRPMLETDALVQSQSWVTRLYTTMSPEEMTEDPVFDFNPDLPAVSNIHTQERIVGCDFNGPWRVEFEAGVVRGTGVGVWPMQMGADDLPAALRISVVGTSGSPTVMIDNTDEIRRALDIDGLDRDEADDDEDDDVGADEAPSAGAGGDGDRADDPDKDEDEDEDEDVDQGVDEDHEDTGGDRVGDSAGGDDSKGSGGDDGGLFCHVATPGAGSGLEAPFSTVLVGLLASGWLSRRRRRAHGRGAGGWTS
ncbi:MAG: DUF2330 domain-containing protein [Myxococcales bacterium]|nr:DUF2330 domain-containing protein [Myxococcales bacterium]